jgi:hypothetical protein
MVGNIYKTIGELVEAANKSGNDFVELFQNGKSYRIKVSELLKFNAYDVAIGNTTQLNLNNTVFTIDNTDASAKAITLPTNLPANRACTIIVVIRGKVGTVTWDANIKWSDNTAPTLANTVTIGILLWDGISVHGSAGASY